MFVPKKVSMGYMYISNVNNEQRWRHQMESFSGFLALCVGNSPASDEFPSYIFILQRPVTRSFDVFFDLHLSK